VNNPGWELLCDFMKYLKIMFPFVMLSFIASSCQNRKTTPVRKKTFPTGKWSWQKENNTKNEKIISREIWQIQKSGKKFKVNLTLFNLGVSKTNFTCNGAKVFNIKAKYTFKKVSLIKNNLFLENPVIKKNSSPCSANLPTYKKVKINSLIGNRLFLMNDKKGKELNRHKIEGVWVWRRNSPVKNTPDQKIEIEEWVLNEKNGVITGYYNRIVMRLSSDDRKFSCNGKKAISFFARYDVEGKLFENGQITLKEIKYYIPKNDDCEPSGERHLDSFKGVFFGDKIKLKSTEDEVEQTLVRRYGVHVPIIMEKK
jgi:hypothetical protein